MDYGWVGSDRPLTDRFDVALLDLDGVVYVGDAPVPGVSTALIEARRRGMRLAFVTNNASRTPDAVAARLSGMGIAATPDEVATSAQAAAHVLADELPAGAAVLVVGGEGLVEALRERGLRPVSSAVDEQGEPVAAVAQGFSPTVGWSALAEAAVAIRAGAVWLATNLDRTIPSERGPLPGNGSLVHALAHATGVVPRATGKPDPTMHRESVERSGAHDPIVVGDRLDTDIEGAVRVGVPSLLVLSGVADPAVVLGARPGERPDYVARTVRGLLEVHPQVSWDGPEDGPRRLGRWSAVIDGGRIVLRGEDRPSPEDGPSLGNAGSAEEVRSAEDGGAADDELDALRLVAPAVWRCRDDVDRFAERGSATSAQGPGGLLVAADDAAASLLARWGVTGGPTGSGEDGAG